MQVGWGRARQMLLLGENFIAAQALEWKFVEQMTPRGQLDDAVRAFVRQALNCAPAAVRLQKSLIRSWEDLPLRAAIAAGDRHIRECLQHRRAAIEDARVPRRAGRAQCARLRRL
jgi:enoyl-CoA hydratase/carnithine racemase